MRYLLKSPEMDYLSMMQGFQRAAELAPRERTTPELLQTWRAQLATSTATSALLQVGAQPLQGLGSFSHDVAKWCSGCALDHTPLGQWG